MCILLRLGDVALLYALFRQPFSQNVVHSLRWESNWVWELDVVLGHGGEIDILGVGEVGLGRAVETTQELGELANTIGAVVEGEDGVAVCEPME